MNEPNYPLDERLSRFEQDLKSLSPKPYVLASPLGEPCSIQDLGLPAQTQTVALPTSQTQRFPFTNPSWLKTVAVAWSTGLAAGLLVSAIWIRWTTSASTVIAANLVSVDPSSLPANALNPNVGSQQDLQPIKPPRSPEANRSGLDDIAGSKRHVALDSSDHGMLHPLMPLHAIDWNWRTLSPIQQLMGVEYRFPKRTEQQDAPNSSSSDTPSVSPMPSSAAQGQRQLLKSLMESNDMVSI